MKDMKKFAKTLSKVLKVIEIITIVSAVIFFALVSGLLIYSMNNSLDYIINEVNFGHITVGLENYQLTTETIRNILISLMLIIPMMTLPMVFLFKTLRKLVISTSEGRPFSFDNAKRIKRISLIIFITSVLNSIAAATLKMLVFFELEDSLIASGAAKSFSYKITVLDFPTIFICAVIYLIALIFEYGTKLQEEADTTL